VIETKKQYVLTTRRNHPEKKAALALKCPEGSMEESLSHQGPWQGPWQLSMAGEKIRS